MLKCVLLIFKASKSQYESVNMKYVEVCRLYWNNFMIFQYFFVEK